MKKNTTRLDKIILGGGGDRPFGSGELPAPQRFGDNHLGTTQSGLKIDQWYEKIIERLQQYRLDFNRALDNTTLAIGVAQTDDAIVFESCNVALKLWHDELTIECLLLFDRSDSSQQLATRFENKSGNDSPSLLIFENEEISIDALSKTLRKVFGLFIEAASENMEVFFSEFDSSNQLVAEVHELSPAIIEQSARMLCQSESSHETPFAALLGPGERLHDPGEQNQSTLLSQLVSAARANEPSPSTSLVEPEMFATADNYLEPTLIETSETFDSKNNEEELSMLQTRESSLIESFRNVRSSLERELNECSKAGAKAFETRDMQEIQHAATRLNKVQNLKERIEASLDEWIGELSD